MSLFAELRRRNVFRVGIAYAISAWIVLQVADVIGEIMELPEWGGKLILLMVIVGFPLALIFAWAFELTPEGLKREKDVDRSASITPQTGKKLNNAILVLMALAIAYLLYDKFSGTRPDSVSTPAAEVAQSAARPETEPAPGTDTRASRQSIAVLPFDNRSNREEDQFFTDGIHDDLLTTIARIGSMKVISRTSVMEYKGTTKKIPQIAAELGVAHILEGGIQRSGNQVRINVQLIDAQTDEHLWAEIYDRELTAENLFAIQSEISTKIAEALQTTLSPEERRGISRMPTQDLEAYDAYLRGKQLLATRRTEDIEEATRQFQRAVELDRNFALAWVGVADSFDLLNDYTSQDSGAFMGIRQEAVDRALALQPDLGEAYTSLGALHVDRHRQTGSSAELAAAETAFRRSIELSPNYATAYQWYSNSMINDALRSRERLELAIKAVELDPRSAIIGANLANEYLVQGLFSRGEQQVRKLIEINPGFPNSYHMMVDHHLWNTGQLAKALANAEKLLELDAGNTDARRHQIEVYVEIGDFETARAIQDQITELDPEDIWAVHADLLVALQTGSAAAAGESLRWWAGHFLDTRPWLVHQLEEHYLQIGETKRAFQLLLQGQPRWTDPSAWDELVRQDGTGGCQPAWLMIHEGDQTLGLELLKRALVFQEQELPGVIEHADRRAPEICYLARGDSEKALAAMETAVSHGHFFGWTRWSHSPMYDPIRLDPRFLALIEERDRKVAAQRELIEQGSTEAGP
jgi:TolB-like protein/Tfp pilus assembly protein PilF